MKTKKFLALGLVLVLVLSMFVGCGQSTNTSSEEGKKEDDKIVIGVAASSFSDKWQTYLYDAIKAEAEKEGNVEVVFTDGKDDSATQLANVENLVAQGVDAIILVIVDTDAPQPYVKLCKEAKIPLIGVNRIFEGCDVYVGSESIDAGIVQMEKVVELIGKKGNIGILRGPAGQEAEIKRTEGNKQVADKYENVNIIRTEVGMWDRAKGMEITENWIQSGDEFAAIVSNNDEMAIGAIRALEAEGKLDDVIVAGVDATIDALEYVKEGKLDITVFQSPFGQGGESLKAAVKLVKGEKVEKNLWVPFELVTKENVEEYIAKWQ
ncbi:MAG: sugar ABC transporter substrate-binding protein [Anaeromicrobium sp.]|jgi:inositol transport system substrate-binding protein|uniref:sugar ABC transporter substrate-binding protein n=1 Tax=Anaeromicrobium sp. TaxID=1929132 RepID=UPI0025DF6E99|nr:sugar ABC transporter substrate-binding protein [Anaeromicrobium sp.]MCT4593863.1 sugar ABC transporter substrate-binding protein [Anaeromicrobium sp.]